MKGPFLFRSKTRGRPMTVSCSVQRTFRFSCLSLGALIPRLGSRNVPCLCGGWRGNFLSYRTEGGVPVEHNQGLSGVSSSPFSESLGGRNDNSEAFFLDFLDI